MPNQNAIHCLCVIYSINSFSFGLMGFIVNHSSKYKKKNYQLLICLSMTEKTMLIIE